MNDVGADTSNIMSLIENYDYNNSIKNKSSICIPQEGLNFIENTFNCIKTSKLSNIAAIFTFGRETTIPDMFLKILNKIDSKNVKYKNLRSYINRHIEIDSSRHGPLSMHLFEYTCKNDQKKYDEAIDYAIDAIDKRIKLWDGVLKELSRS